MLLYFILVVFSIITGFFCYQRTTDLRELQKYTANLENDLLQKQIALEEMTQHTKLPDNFLLNAIDEVSGLPTPQLFEDRALQTFHLSKRFGKSFSILFVDITGFKHLYEKYGSDKSNKLLNDLAKRFNNCIRQIDTLTRYRADIFLFLLPQLAQPETAAYVANRLLANLKTPFVVDGEEIILNASIGISVYPMDGDSLQTLIDHANNALQKAKLSASGGNYLFHSKDLQEISEREATISKTLLADDLEGKLAVYCLPQVNALSGKIIAIKAIPYLLDPELGLLTFDDYSKVADREHKLTSILCFAIAQAIRQFPVWQKNGVKPERLALNINAKQLQDEEFYKQVSKILAENDFNPNLFAFEVSADNFSENAASIQNAFLKFKKLGVHLSIGVFALGQLAIQKITQLPISYLKIDQRLVKTLTQFNENETILGALMDLSQNMGMQTVVEGVDEAKQKELLSKMGFEIMQGKLFGEPQPIDKFKG